MARGTTSAFAFTYAPTPFGHPHDGLNVHSHGRVWFDEEVADRLAKAALS